MSVGWLLGAIVGACVGVVVTFVLLRRSRLVAVPARPSDAPEAAPAAFDPFARIVQALPVGVVVLDGASRVQYANAAAGTIFGFDPARATGTHLIQAIPNVALETRVAEALRGQASIAPLTFTLAQTARTFRISVYPLRADGEPHRVVLFADDQTDLVRLDRARKDFLSNVSHELRTPLASIKLMLETVIASPGEEAVGLFAPQALAQVDRLAALVAQLLDQARVESGNLQLALREVDLETIAAPIVASFEHQAANAQVALDLLPQRPVRLEADPDRLAQVFVNLIDNALRHTPSGGRVAAELDVEGGDALIRIRDTGSGIPYRDLPRIFERFYVVDRSRARERGGAGLGLAIVKGIVDAHGGAISAESALGRGTTITIRLPIAHPQGSLSRA